MPNMARRGNDDPSIPDVATGNNTEPDLVPMKNKFIQKFYEPVVILSALMESAKKVIPPATSVLSPFDKGNNRETYHSFVYKLAHVCTSDQAKTITAFMILRHEEDSDRAHYMFASNGRKPGELEETAEFVRELLRMAGSASPNKPLEQRIRIRREVFTLVLRFNRPRIKMYLQKLRARIEKCQQECRKERTEENTRINEELEDLLRPINAVTPHCSENTYLNACQMIMVSLIRHSQTSAGKTIRIRAEAASDSMPGDESRECWHHLVHTTQRIIAYSESVRFIMRARELWPQLFREPKVSFVPSSVPWKTPGRNKSMKAINIIGRMTSNAELQRKFKDFVQDMSWFNLDKRIEEEYSKGFRPIVHAEILLLNWLDLTTADGVHGPGRIDHSRFWNDWAYIGSSKPTCKLCAYYFQAHRSGVGYRPSHGNLYMPWRGPDVSRSTVQQHHGPGEVHLDKFVKARQDILNRVLELVREEAFDVISKKARSTYKRYDSNTFSNALSASQQQHLSRGADASIGSRHSEQAENDDAASTITGSNGPRGHYTNDDGIRHRGHVVTNRYVSAARKYDGVYAVDDVASVMGQMGLDDEVVQADRLGDSLRESSPESNGNADDDDDDDEAGGAIL